MRTLCDDRRGSGATLLSGERWGESPMPKIKHIALATQDVENTAQFYIATFGMKEVGKINDRHARRVSD